MSSSPAEECRSPVGLDCCSCCLDLANRSGLEEGAGGENNNPGSPTVSSFRQLREQLVRQNLNTDKLSSIMRQDSLEPVVRDPCYLFNQGICNRNIDQTLLSILLLFHRWVSPPGAAEHPGAAGSELAALWGRRERGTRVTPGLGGVSGGGIRARSPNVVPAHPWVRVRVTLLRRARLAVPCVCRAVTTAPSCVSWPLGSVLISLATSVHTDSAHRGMDSVQRQRQAAAPSCVESAAGSWGSSCAASKAILSVTESLGRDPESPSASSCPLAAPLALPAVDTTLARSSACHPWKVALPWPS